MVSLQTPSQPRASRRNLVERIGLELRRKLQAGVLQAGDRLPTEHALARSNGVSRTVVREAIAGLRADGLVIARQGAGLFVAERSGAAKPLRLLEKEPQNLSTIIECLELRAAVEGEAAALAAERCSPSELAKIKECHRAVAMALAGGESAVEQDFSLHLAIAESTDNRQFVEFFRFLGGRTIPRGQASDEALAAATTPGYLRRIFKEHAGIVNAIAARDPVAAHTAMRAHLKGSQDRYARLAEGEFDRIAP